MSEAALFRIKRFDEVSSTNEEIKRAIAAGEPEGLAVLARCQTGGYGRQGRLWASPEGGMYFSLLLRPAVNVSQLPTLSLVVALAVRRAVRALLAPVACDDIQVKWPNDVVIGGAGRANTQLQFPKLCGISLEAVAGGVCVGIGVNVYKPTQEAALVGKNTPFYLADRGFSGSIEAVAQSVVEAFAEHYEVWLEAGFSPFLDEYQTSAALAGHQVSMVNLAGTVLAQGVVETVDKQGCLVLVHPDGARVAVASGEAHLA